MNGRERILTAAACREADRAPIDFWATEEVFTRLQAELKLSDREGLLRHFGVDLRYFRGPTPPSRTEPGEITVDHWGVKREGRTVTGRRRDGQCYTWHYHHLAQAPLAGARSVADIEKHAWPDPSGWDYSGVKATCQAIRDSGCAVVFGGDRLDRTAQLKAAMYLRGTEEFMADLALEPAVAECLLQHIAAYYLEYNRRVFEAAGGLIDVFFMGDDLGTQQSLWVSAEMYRKFFFDRFAAFNAQAHRYGARTMFHTCGRVTPLVGLLVDAGLDILQSLQPEAIGEEIALMKREFGRRLCFQGGIDIQHVLPSGSPGDVAEHVRDRAAILAPGGGYIFGTAHNILPDTPTENILAMVGAYHKYGLYR